MRAGGFGGEFSFAGRVIGGGFLSWLEWFARVAENQTLRLRQRDGRDKKSSSDDGEQFTHDASYAINHLLPGPVNRTGDPRNREKLRRRDGPTTATHGTADKVVPVSASVKTKARKGELRELKRWRVIGKR